jgi:hypothetical protein
LGDWIGFANQHAKKFVAKWSGGKDPEEAQILQTIGKLNLQQGTSAFSKFGCKNEGFVTAMVTKGAELHRDGFKLNKVRRSTRERRWLGERFWSPSLSRRCSLSVSNLLTHTQTLSLSLKYARSHRTCLAERRGV